MPKSKTRAVATRQTSSGRKPRGTRPRSARSTKGKNQAVDVPSSLVPGQESGSQSGPTTAVPPSGAAGGLLLGDLPGPAAPPEFGESTPVGAQPRTSISSHGHVTANTSAVVNTTSLSVPLHSSMPVNAAQPLTNVHDLQPLTSVCDELGLGVPKQIQDKIWNGEYVDFGTLLRPVRGGYANNSPQDCVLLIGSSESPTLQIRPPAQHTRITSVEQWTSAFLVFASIYLTRHPNQARQLLKYADTVRSAAFRRAGYGWRDYDIQFRLRQARMPSRSWASIDAELWLTLVGGPTQNFFRPLPLRATQQRAPGTGRFPSQHDQRAAVNGICFDFNRGHCFRVACRFAHKCSACLSVGHPASTCRGSPQRAGSTRANSSAANPGKTI